MTNWAIVPVKPFQIGKARLGGVLTVEQRVKLNRLLMIRTIHVLNEVRSLDSILVISRSGEVLELARKAGCCALEQNGSGGLNSALYQVNNKLCKSEDCVIVIPTDLPLMTSDDIFQLLEMGKNPPVVIVVPDRHQNGTNALLVNPKGIIRYRFGQKSSIKHMEEARKRNIPVIVKTIQTVSIDLDSPDDLELLKSFGFIIPIYSVNNVEETVS